jgi:hypothetical protein
MSVNNNVAPIFVPDAEFDELIEHGRQEAHAVAQEYAPLVKEAMKQTADGCIRCAAPFVALPLTIPVKKVSPETVANTVNK